MLVVKADRSNLFAALLVILTCSLPSYAHAQAQLSAMPAGVYNNDQAHTSVTWKVSHFGRSNYTANFSDVRARITLDPQNPAASQLQVSINPLSVQTNFPASRGENWNNTLATSPRWFDGQRFPAITFASQSIQVTGANSARINGTLTMLGQQRQITLNARYNGGSRFDVLIGKPVIGFSASTSFKRSDFGMRAFVPQIGDEVKVAIEIEFERAG